MGIETGRHLNSSDSDQIIRNHRTPGGRKGLSLIHEKH